MTTQESNPNPRVSTLLAASVAALVLLPLLGHKPLAEWDEAIYAEVSREMLHGGWFTPHWNAQLWLEKPPLTLWITALFFKLFGVSEFWARAGSAFAGVGTVALLHHWLSRSRDLLTAWISTVILLSTFGFLHICHVGEMDTLLSLAALLALIGLSKLEANQSSGWYLFWIGFAIAVMTKGAAAVVIPLAAVAFAITQRWSPRHFSRAFLGGLAIFLVITLPWHLAMYLRFPDAFVTQYLGLHVLTRATQQIEGHHTAWWYYFVVILASAPPFVLLYPSALWGGLRRPELRPWAIFALLTFSFFTAVQTRLPHYIAPVYAPLALLTAVWVAEVWVAEWIRPRLSLRTTAFWVRAALATTAVWAASIVATHSTLKGLHSADLAGFNLLDNREVDDLLRSAPLPSTPGPLLYLRAGRFQSIATVVFYAGRPVQQVAFAVPPPGAPLNPYTFNPALITDVVGTTPQLILVDRRLIPALQRLNLACLPLQINGRIVLGVISRSNTSLPTPVVPSPIPTLPPPVHH